MKSLIGSAAFLVAILFVLSMCCWGSIGRTDLANNCQMRAAQKGYINYSVRWDDTQGCLVMIGVVDGLEVWEPVYTLPPK